MSQQDVDERRSAIVLLHTSVDWGPVLTRDNRTDVVTYGSMYGMIRYPFHTSQRTG